MLRLLATTLVLLGATAAGAALADGPGGSGIVRSLRSSGGTVYTTSPSTRFGHTRVAHLRGARVIRSASIRGQYGVPVPTSKPDGLSHDGRTLVLAQTGLTGGFVVLDARTLHVRRRIELHGMFTFDALSPTGRMVYLIQHRLTGTGDHYSVRAYDIVQGRLLQQVVFDRREGPGLMSGWPVTRATGPSGRWVYTLYMRPGGALFIHALDTIGRHAFCVDVPWSGSTAAVWSMKLRLAPGRLDVRSSGRLVARIDTQRLRITKTGRP
jgi:hypothetical protein